MRERLSSADVKRLLSEPTESVRADIAQKLAVQFGNVVLTPRERDLAAEIFGYLVHDAAVSVRLALARGLADVSSAPRRIILALARDIDDVAVPVLESSTVLNEEDMIELVLAGSVAKQCAIAGRPNLEHTVAETIVWAAERSAVVTLAANGGTVIRPDLLDHIVAHYGQDEDVLEPLVRRDNLPGPLVERVVTMVSARLRDYLIERHRIGRKAAALLADTARERTLVEMLPGISAERLARLVSQLIAQNRLTPTLMLRAACAGERGLIEAAFSALTGVAQDRIALLLADAGPLGLRTVYTRSGLPEAFYPAFRAAFDVLNEYANDKWFEDKVLLRAHMLDRIRAHYRDVEAGDLDLMLDRLTRLSRAMPWRTGCAA
jgi:uncharacterized protein (DUF2336 family)